MPTRFFPVHGHVYPRGYRPAVRQSKRFDQDRSGNRKWLPHGTIDVGWIGMRQTELQKWAIGWPVDVVDHDCYPVASGRTFPVGPEVGDTLQLEVMFDGKQIDAAADASMFDVGGIDGDGPTRGYDGGSTG